MKYRDKRLSYWYLVWPTLTAILISPAILEMVPMVSVQHVQNFNIYQVILVAPFYLGLISAPGYIFAWACDTPYQSEWGRRWVHWSLIAAMVSSFFGFIFTILTVIVAPFALLSLIFSIKLLSLCRNEWEKSDVSPQN